MRFTNTHKAILTSTDAKSKITARDLGNQLGLPPGPAARSVESLVKNGYMAVKIDKEGKKFYNRTAEGGKIAKTLK